jgi:2-C-methyl-D-erythritol 4-phosphate cytidylyltransferase/2-C-methyl-D-erythritol 2,4-cyclodiphosphate synthase
MHVVAIIAAGGRGTRMGGEVPKQFMALGGRSLLDRCVDVFEASTRVDEIVVVVPSAQAETGRWRKTRKPLHVVAGGERRQDSVALGFDQVPARTDIVVVHDAARPFCSTALIDRTIEAALEAGAAVPATAARDTVKRSVGSGDRRFVESSLPRERIYLAQTPQAFRYGVLREAIRLGRSGVDATDEATLAELAGFPVRLVEGEPHNIKITADSDLTLVRGLAANHVGATRVGIGYDIHRLVEGRPLVLGGVVIPSDRGLAGHSDADAICHAVTDAILGAAAAGNVGQLFPDDDPRWKGASSVDLLRRAAAVVHDRGFQIENVDVVVVLETPRVGPFVPAMLDTLASALGVDRSRVSIKGKTNEGLDAVGRGAAIAVHAMASLVRGEQAK